MGNKMAIIKKCIPCGSGYCDKRIQCVENHVEGCLDLILAVRGELGKASCEKILGMLKNKIGIMSQSCDFTKDRSFMYKELESIINGVHRYTRSVLSQRYSTKV